MSNGLQQKYQLGKRTKKDGRSQSKQIGLKFSRKEREIMAKTLILVDLNITLSVGG